MEFLQPRAASGGAVGLAVFKFGAQVVQEEGADHFQDVPFAGVVRSNLAALLVVHDGLKQGAENGGGDARPILASATKKRVAHVAVEIGKAQMFAEQVAVDVREGGQRLVQVLLPPVFRGVEHAEQVGEVQAEVGAVLGSAVFEVELEGVALEEAGVLCKEAEQHADEEPFELVTAVAPAFQGVVQVAHDLGGFEVDGVLVGKPMLLVAGDEGEGVNVLVELGQREFEGLDRSADILVRTNVRRGSSRAALAFGACCGQECPRSVLGLKVVEGDAGEVRDNYVTRGVLGAAFVEQVLEVLKGLGLGLAEVLSEALVLDQQRGFPEQVNVAVLPRDALDWLLEAGHQPALDAEHVEELVPEGLFLGSLAPRAGPVMRELNGAVADFVP